VIKSLINQQKHAFQSKFASFCDFTNMTKQCKQTVTCAELVGSISC